MLDVAISELTSPQWDLPQELAHLAAHGFDAISLWRPKVSDVGVAAAARLVEAAGVRVSSLQWAGGFTGGDGRSFAESVDDAVEAIAAAATLAAPVVVIHTGCRGGHTRSHAARLLGHALESLLPVASRAGVALAVKAVHPAASANCGFLAGLDEALQVVERFDDPAIRLALDLWHFAHDPGLTALLPRLARATAVVQVADRCGPSAADADRLPAGHGALPLESVVLDLVEHGYAGGFEFDPVGEAVEILGYEGVWRETRLVVDAWSDRQAARRVGSRGFASQSPRGPLQRAQFRGTAGAAARRSHASSHTGSPG